MSFPQDLQPIAAVADQLRGLLAGLDLDLVRPAELAGLVTLGDRVERIGHGLKTRAAAKIADTEMWHSDGEPSAETWIARHTGTPADAARLVETGRMSVADAARTAVAEQRARWARSPDRLPDTG